MSAQETWEIEKTKIKSLLKPARELLKTINVDQERTEHLKLRISELKISRMQHEHTYLLDTFATNKHLKS